MPTQPLSPAEKLKSIREAYIKQLPIQVKAIQRAYDAYAVNPADEDGREEIHRGLHTLRGSSASFGLSGLTSATSAAENLAKEIFNNMGPLDESWHRQMKESLSRMMEEVARLSPADRMEPTPVEPSIVTSTCYTKEPKTVYLCDDDPHQLEYLSAQMECFGFNVVTFDVLDTLRAAVSTRLPDAIVMDLIFPGRPMGGAETIQLLKQEMNTDIPAVFISIQSDFPYRLSAVRAGSSAFFVKPVNVTELCTTLNSLTQAEQPEPYRVMIVDDDRYLAQLHASILQDAGMITLTVNDPLEVMAPLFDFKPDLILMDMYMPGCNGMELAKTIRQLGSSFSIPIVYLSGETDTDKQFRAIRMGGDEFLTKPISPDHLISAVAGRAERMKIIRSLMIKDGMTGLYNHTAIKEYLDTASAQAQRQGSEVCFAMIDLDNFKNVNDTYGHLVGDQVLVTLSRLLRQRIRSSDVVGRYGGEEFAIVLPDCNIDLSVKLIDQLRENFASIRYPVGDTSFSTTFSAGIAALSVHGGGALLCQAADQALYQAKNEGKNRVVAV